MDDLEAIWCCILNSIKRSNQSLSSSCIDIYSEVSDFIDTRFGEDWTNCGLIFGPNNECLDEHVRKLLSTHLGAFLDGEFLATIGSGDIGLSLTSYVNQWEDYCFASEILDGVCQNLEQYSPAGQAQDCTARTCHLELYQTALTCWRYFLEFDAGRHITDALLSVINEQRRGRAVDEDLLLKTIDVYIQLGQIEASNEMTSLGYGLCVYENLFERSFLESTERYYSEETNLTFEGLTVEDYLLRVERILIEENRQCRAYLHWTTKPKLNELCENILIRTKTRRLEQAFKTLLERHNDRHLELLHRLYKRVLPGPGELEEVLTNYIVEFGLARLVGGHAGEPATREANEIIGIILNVHTKFGQLVENTLHGDPHMAASVRRAMELLVNDRIAAFVQSKTQPHELVAAYCDSLLISGPTRMDIPVLDARLEQICSLFQRLTEKEAFLGFYAELFGRRLIGACSISEELELRMISKLESVCGSNSLSNLKHMHEDINVLSPNLKHAFLEWCRHTQGGCSLEVDFNVNILAERFWPGEYMASKFTIPAQLRGHAEKFNDFYLSQFRGRKLTWVYGNSTAEVQSYCFKRHHVFRTSALQMAALVQYNHSDACKLGDLALALGIDASTTEQVLDSLVRAKLLCQLGEHQEQPKRICRGRENAVRLFTSYALNATYSGPTDCVDIETPIMPILGARATLVRPTRGYVDLGHTIQASIVRTMKRSKRFSRRELISTVSCELTAAHCMPRKFDIDRSIESLVRREYMRRENDTYIYIP